MIPIEQILLLGGWNMLELPASYCTYFFTQWWTLKPLETCGVLWLVPLVASFGSAAAMGAPFSSRPRPKKTKSARGRSCQDTKPPISTVLPGTTPISVAATVWQWIWGYTQHIPIFFGHPASCKRCSDAHFRSTQWDPYDTANKDEGYFWLRLRFWRASHNTKGWTLSAPLQLRDKVPFSWCVCSKFRKRQRFASQNAVRLPVSDCLSCMAGVKENEGKIIWRFPKMGVPLSHVF